MADSNITKRALAAALQELMDEMPFDKIQITQICERCDMNRKSFYYHFKDKYDLVNWIFDTEFISFARESAKDLPSDDRWELIERACEHFYANRAFYSKALMIKGQNSLADHLREYLFPLIKIRIAQFLSDDDKFTTNFFTDAVFCAIERWLLDKQCVPTEEFVTKIKQIMYVGGCVAGGRNYLHINAKGDVEPCVFIHYSNANIHETSLLNALKSPLFMAYHDGQPFNDNMLRPCPMLENPELLRKMVRDTGALSTDYQSPENVDHLCDKTTPYAENWKSMADTLWMCKKCGRLIWVPKGKGRIQVTCTVKKILISG